MCKGTVDAPYQRLARLINYSSKSTRNMMPVVIQVSKNIESILKISSLIISILANYIIKTPNLLDNVRMFIYVYNFITFNL